MIHVSENTLNDARPILSNLNCEVSVEDHYSNKSTETETLITMKTTG